jgi:hypothetical protein
VVLCGVFAERAIAGEHLDIFANSLGFGLEISCDSFGKTGVTDPV